LYRKRIKLKIKNYNRKREIDPVEKWTSSGRWKQAVPPTRGRNCRASFRQRRERAFAPKNMQKYEIIEW
jgi:hypothetical protein